MNRIGNATSKLPPSEKQMKTRRLTTLNRLLFVLVICCLHLFKIDVFSQENWNSSTPVGWAKGTPAGSYALSGFDNVNLFNGHLNFHLPLLKVGGRGSAGYTMALPIEQVWTSQLNDPNNFTGMPSYNWWDGIKPGYGPGVLQARHQSEGCYETFQTVYGTTRLTFTTSDGTEFELIDPTFGGQPAATSCGANGSLNIGVSRGTTWVTRDGSSATFISDQAVHDNAGIEMGLLVTYPTGYLKLRDGIVYRIVQGRVQWQRDRNGNRIDFTYSETSGQLVKITDALKREITIQYNQTDSQYGTCDWLEYKRNTDSGTTTRKIKVCRNNLGSVLDSGQSLKTPGGTNGLFPESGGSSTTNHDPQVASAVVLPDNRTYLFRYNSYGELTKVTLPTGGVVTYLWGKGLESGTASGYLSYKAIYRRVLEKRTYINNGTTLASLTSFGRYSDIYASEGYAWLKQHKVDGTEAIISQSKHTFHSSPYEEINASGMWLPDLIDGREKKTEVYDAAGSVVLVKTTNTWAHRTTLASTSIDPQITTTEKTIEPASANMVSKQTFTYDSYNNQSEVHEYDFGIGAAPSNWTRRTATTFLTTHPVTFVNYATDPHIRNLPLQVSVYDQSGEKARTTFEYDNYTPEAAPCANSVHCLVDRSNIVGLDSSFNINYQKRGNLTGTTKHLLFGGSGSISSYSQFDIAGNVVKTTDARGFATHLFYDDCFGSPNGEAQTTTNPIELGVTNKTFAFVTKVTNTLNQSAYRQFDYYLGLAVDAGDINGVLSSAFFANEPLDRLTELVQGVGTAAESHTFYSYNDANRIVTTTGDLNAVNDQLLKNQDVYDQLGRVMETRQYEGGTNYIAVQTEYDALGRPFKVSNPFRPWQSETAVWTTTTFDSGGRVDNVTLPDNSVVHTDYDGNRVLVKDQAGKYRISRSNALGQLTEVWEVTAFEAGVTQSVTFPGHSGVTDGYLTHYDYDVLGNLSQVTQGGQSRFFLYDSLSRLIRARNPEQGTYGTDLSHPSGNSAWSLKYTYDGNNNLTTRTDPRSVVATYVYDSLNRNTQVTYTDATPKIERYFDGATRGKGLLWYEQTLVGSELKDYQEFSSYDHLGRPLQLLQRFRSDSVNYDYKVQRTYNRAGLVTAQTYPSGHAVTYNYDMAGRLADKDSNNLAFTGNLGDGAQRTYSRGITYASAGQLKQEQFGTVTSVFNKRTYNSRQQLTEVLASTTGNDTTFNRGKITNNYGTTNNNGNLLSQQTYVPNNDQNTNPTWWTQNYNYDALNRLNNLNEVNSAGSGLWQQYFKYDRFGNRRTDLNNTSAISGVLSRIETAISQTTNRLYANGETDASHSLIDYDLAGNQTKDYYTSGANQDRTYDAENRMIGATVTIPSVSTIQSSYKYNSGGQRVRRTTGTVETWQVYGMDGELLADYQAKNPAFLVTKEYGYRNGSLLVTMASSDVKRIQRFVKNLYFNAFARDATTNELQTQTAALGTAGNQSSAQLLTTAKSITRTQFESSEYAARNRTDTQFVTDLYNVYLQRGPDDSGLAWWVSNTVNNGREATLNAFEQSSEFSSMVSTLYGIASGDNQRVENFVKWFYYGAYRREPTSNELQTQTQRLNNAAALGLTEVVNEAKAIGGEIFEATNYNSTRTVTEYVTDLYEAFLQRTPDTGGLNFWVGNTNTNGRAATLAAFKAAGEYAALAGSLWRETFWFVDDHVGTPRMLIGNAGSLASVKRHDYLPFGEELSAGVGNRTTGVGYQSTDEVRQKFTSKERDVETALDYFVARYYSNTQGRFIGVDPLISSGETGNPQTWNRYGYVDNNPLAFVDPDGKLKKDRSGKLVYKPKRCGWEQHLGSTERTGPNTLRTTNYYGETGELETDDGTKITAFRSRQVSEQVELTLVNGRMVQTKVFEGSQRRNDRRMDTNCHGLTFTLGGYWINNDQVMTLLRHDGYRPTDQTNPPRIGDIAVYFDANNNVVHTATVTEVDGNGGVRYVAGVGGIQTAALNTTPDMQFNAARIEYWHKPSEPRANAQRRANFVKRFFKGFARMFGAQ
jgi:RHS repeat-associated protein